MKLTKGKKIALISFAVFLAFMAVCTVAAKGIYASGLPRVSTTKPYSGSLTHVITVNGTVMQGQEYGVYVESGLRVDTVAVSSGDTFQAGQELFRIETADLAEIIRQRRLETAKLEVQMAAAVKEADSSRQSRKREADRAREDYDRKALLADEQIQVCQQAYDAAQRALALYDQYLIESEQEADEGEDGEKLPGGAGEGSGSTPEPAITPEPPESSESSASGEGSGNTAPEPPGNVESSASGESSGNTAPEPPESNENLASGESSGNTAPKPPESNESSAAREGISAVTPEFVGSGAGSAAGGAAEDIAGEPGGSGADEEGSLHELSAGGIDPEQNYNRQEKRLQLEQDVVKAAQALEEAMRQKEDSLRDAARLMEDANAAQDAAGADVNMLALDITYQKEGLQKLEALLEADGWVYAESPGRVLRCSLETGGRTQDEAGIVYALDGGERILSAALSESQSRYIAVGTRFEMKATMPDGSRAAGEALVDYLEKGQDGTVQARLSYDLQEMDLGQAAELTYRMQTESYSICISRNCVYKEGENSYYVYVAEEREGILGTEWKVRKAGIRILDENDTAAAVQSAELTGDSRIVAATDKPLKDGDTVRVVQ
ncbi:MAG TPA: hypothetical protein DCZ91_01495 [Lachnospiraceae bacterium]|nr:hypothetical protein [Lachnospiraceae bacterium]